MAILHGRSVDLTGQKFGRLTVKEVSEPPAGKKSKELFWFCECDCGGTKIARGYSLRIGDTTSCGCFQKERCKNRDYKKTHGQTKTRLYNVWARMNARCYGVNQPDYKNYGERGIKVCDEWRKFENFRDWALANGYSDELTIERKDVNKGYNPDNCCFIPAEEQARNRTTTKWVTAWGETKRVSEWLEDYRCTASNINTLRGRLARSNSPEEAIQKGE